MRNIFTRQTVVLLLILLILVFASGILVGQVTAVQKYNYLTSTISTLPSSTIATVPPTSTEIVYKTGLPEFVDEDVVDFTLFWDVWESVENRYYKQPVEDEKLFYGAIKGMVAALGDPYTTFFDPEEANTFNNDLEGKFEGIGAEIAIKNDILTIVAPLKDSPAERAGLLPGDKVFAIDGIETALLSLNDAVKKIRGPKGSTVVLNVLHKIDTAPVDIAVIRDKIVINTIKWELIGKDKDIAYISIFSFNPDTVKDFSAAVSEIVKKKPRGIILDLRSNPGGLLDAAVEISSFWIEDGIIVNEKNSLDAESVIYKATGRARLKSFETVVLVNVGSASGSEIVAGALRDYDKGVIVGETTFGKGSVQDYTILDGGSGLKVTIAEWLTPNGISINEDGIVPDIIIELTREDYNQDLDPQLDKAIELLE